MVRWRDAPLLAASYLWFFGQRQYGNSLDSSLYCTAAGRVADYELHAAGQEQLPVVRLLWLLVAAEKLKLKKLINKEVPILRDLLG